MAKVKICGITNLEDALYAASQGAGALGFVFYKKSPRYISPAKAGLIIEKLPETVKKVGVFVNEREATIRKIAGELKLDILQFHGNESKDFCRRFRGVDIIKAFRLYPAFSNTKGRYIPIVRKGGIKDKICLADLSKYDVWAYLFDTFSKDKFGGTGKNFNWRILSCLIGVKKPIFLSGGLNSRNVRKALKIFPAEWVDASSSLEKYPGKKNPAKVKAFLKIATEHIK
ncbi:MAG: phosphoribosylanthranilate isomerase [Candidatus Omnitrophota bacterium]